MKVGLCNKKLWRKYSYYVSVICGIFSFSVIFIEIPEKFKYFVGLSLFVLLIFIYFIMLFNANKLNKTEIEINQTRFIVKFGDLFLEQGLKTIAFNEYFDTEVAEHLISPKSINGIFLEKFNDNIPLIDEKIENSDECKKRVMSINNDRSYGKKKCYQLGTALRYDNYVLIAFSKFDEYNRAYLTLADYLSCLANYWEEINRVYNGEDIVLPLLGTGITRLKCGNSITYQRALEIILQTFEYSNLSFARGCKVTLVLAPDLKKEINLYNLGGK